MLGGCPLTWALRLQSEIALSTEAECIALSSTAMSNLLPTRAILKEVGKNLQLCYCNKSTFLSRVWEDNHNGATSEWAIMLDGMYHVRNSAVPCIFVAFYHVYFILPVQFYSQI